MHARVWRKIALFPTLKYISVQRSYSTGMRSCQAPSAEVCHVRRVMGSLKRVYSPARWRASRSKSTVPYLFISMISLQPRHMQIGQRRRCRLLLRSQRRRILRTLIDWEIWCVNCRHSWNVAGDCSDCFPSPDYRTDSVALESSSYDIHRQRMGHNGRTDRW